MSRLRLAALAGAVMAASLVLACGGGGTKGTTPSAAAGGSSPAAGKTAASSTAAPTSGGGSGATADPELRAVAAKFAQSKFHATYKATGTDADPLSGGMLVLVKDGDQKFRFDVTTQQDGKDVSIVFIQSDGVSAFCLKDAGDLGALLGIDAGEGVCFKTSQGDASNPVGSLQGLLKDIENVDATLIGKTKRTIAGQEATCYETKDNADGVISTSCFTDGGVLLYVKTAGDSPSEIEAQSVSSNVSDDDFTLPYEERELPGGLGAQ